MNTNRNNQRLRGRKINNRRVRVNERGLPNNNFTNRQVRINNKNRQKQRRFRGIRRMRINNNRIRRNNNIRMRTTSKIENEIKKVNNKLNDMTIKTTNLIVNKKELRTDRLVSPYTMARRGQYIPIYEIKEKVLNMSVYTKLSITLNASEDDMRYTLVFFPYSINFKPELYTYYSNQISVQAGAANHYKNVYFMAENITRNTFTASYQETADSGIIGNWKLIGSSMKIYNTSSMINKGGDFSIIKIQDNEFIPSFIHSGVNMGQGVANWLKLHINKDYSQAPRNNFSASDTAFIDEYNVANGTNIFSSPFEYLGCKYISSDDNDRAGFTYDLVGNNVAYLFQTKGVGNAQNYVFEIWNVFSVIPCPSSGLGNLGTVNKKCFTKFIVDSIKERPNMYKANK
jgi:hypothetical protein